MLNDFRIRHGVFNPLYIVRRVLPGGFEPP